MLRDQKVVLEVQNRPLLPRVFSAFQSSEMPLEIPSELHLGIPFEISPEMHLEMHFEIPPELHLDMHFEISTNNEIYGRSIWVCAAHRLELKDTPRRANKQQEETAIPSPTQNPTPNLLIKLQLGRISISEVGGVKPKVPPTGNPSPAPSTCTARTARTTRRINGA